MSDDVHADLETLDRNIWSYDNERDPKKAGAALGRVAARLQELEQEHAGIPRRFESSRDLGRKVEAKMRELEDD